MKYKILEGDKATLEQHVNAHLNDGWSLHGGAYCINQTHFQPISLGAEISLQAETLGEAVGPVEHTHVISLDTTDLKKTLGDFLAKFTESATGEAKKGTSKEKA